MNMLVAVCGALLVLGPLCTPQAHAREAGKISTPQFDVTYPRTVAEADVRTLATYLQRRCGDIQRTLGIPMARRIEVRVHESVGAYLADTRLPKPWRGAYYARGVLHIQPIQALRQRGIFERVLSFELAEAYLEPVVEKGCPRWLREAFAVAFCGELGDLTPPIGAKLASFSDLNQDLQVYQEPPQRDDVHFILGHTFRFFQRTYGNDKVALIFKEFDGTKSIETVLRKVLALDYGAVEKAWSKDIQAKTSRTR
jgi:hypothetical protein